MALNGIDIASYQKTMDVANVDADFIIIKSTQGNSYLNPTFKEQYNKAKQAGKLLGIYHYISGVGADAEAQHFVNSIKSVNGVGEAILAVDEQKDQNSKFGNATYVKQLMDKIYSLTGVKPFIYISHTVCNNYNNIQAAGYPLWGAQYDNYKASYYQASPWDDGKPWGKWGSKPTIRQYKGTGGRVKGYSGDVDLDIFYGTKQDWKKFATPVGKTNTTTTTPVTNQGGNTKVTVAKTDFKKYAGKISNSGGDENWGIHGGKAGDNTGHEWEIRSWYNRPWNCILRHPNQQVRDLIAELAIEAANNDNIGYDQWQRETYWSQLQKVGYRPSKITTPCESDCSAGVIANAKAVGYLLGNSALKGITSTYTGNMRAGFKAAGFQVLTDSKYLNSQDYLMPGDILLNDTHHTATNLGIGSKSGYKAANNVVDLTAGKTIDQMAKEILSGNNPYGDGDERIFNLGDKYEAVQKRVNELIAERNKTNTTPAPTTTNKVPVYSGTYSKTVARKGQVTANLLNIRLQPTIKAGNLTSYPTLKKGTEVGICMQTKDEDGDPWYYIKITGNKGEKFGFASAAYIKLI